MQPWGQSIDVLLFGKQDLVSVPPPEGLKMGRWGISPDGEEIAFQQVLPSRANSDPKTQGVSYRTILSVVQTDGKNLRQFWQVNEPTEFSWSPNREHLAFVSAIKSETGVVTAHQLQLLDLKSGKITPVDVAVTISSQCWSQNGSSLVFEKGGVLRVFKTEAGTATTLTSGDRGTWSPAGGSIAFRRGGSYYTINPSGSDEKLLIERKNALTSLWWSSDSKYVSYVAQPSLWKTSWHIMDELDLRVMRLADRKEAVVYRFSGKGRPPDFQWVKNSALLARAKAESHP
jgi:dipeptidyl aminopeptidase/acylaminoacyl peptidase